MCTSSIENGPSSSVSPGATSSSSTSRSLCSSSFERAIAIVSAPAVHGRQCAMRAELAQHPRQRAEMVLVAVRDDDRLDVLRALAQIGEVGQHQVDADHLRRREAQTDVDDHDRARRARRRSCSCRSPPTRRGAGRAASSSRAALRRCAAACRWPSSAPSRPWRSSIARTAGELLRGGLHDRQAQAADVVAEQVQRGLRAGRARRSGTASRRRRAATRRSPRGARARRPSGASRCRRCGWRRGSRRRRPCRACARTSRRRRRTARGRRSAEARRGWPA